MTLFVEGYIYKSKKRRKKKKKKALDTFNKLATGFVA